MEMQASATGYSTGRKNGCEGTCLGDITGGKTFTKQLEDLFETMMTERLKSHEKRQFFLTGLLMVL